MAKYEITRKCGHTETVQIPGPIDGRESQEAYQTTLVCAECHEARIAEMREAKTLDARLESVRRGLVPLIGTQGQIDWANQIRLAILDQRGPMEARILAETPEENRVQCLALVEEVSAMFHAQASSAWWIRNRETSYEREINRLMRS